MGIACNFASRKKKHTRQNIKYEKVDYGFGRCSGYLGWLHKEQ